jgi:hypothetical protein
MLKEPTSLSTLQPWVASESPSLLGETSRSDKVTVASPQADYPLKVAVLYQDAPSRRRAARVCDQATELVGEESIQSTWWDLNRLGDPDVLMDAALAAMRADILVVSIYDTKELPAGLCAWMGAWLPHRRLPAGALIALIGVPDQPGAQFHHIHEFLRAGARKGKLDFLLREHPVSVLCPASSNAEGALQPASATSPVLQESPA